MNQQANRRLGGRATAAAVVVASLGAILLWRLTWWLIDAGVYLGPTSLLLWLAVGAAAGLISNRFRDALLTSTFATTAVLVTMIVVYTQNPSFPAGEDGWEGDLPIVALFFWPLIAAGHLLGVVVARQLRGMGRAPR